MWNCVCIHLGLFLPGYREVLFHGKSLRHLQIWLSFSTDLQLTLSTVHCVAFSRWLFIGPRYLLFIMVTTLFKDSLANHIIDMHFSIQLKLSSLLNKIQ